jgi:hypothetical protein
VPGKARLTKTKDSPKVTKKMIGKAQMAFWVTKSISACTTESIPGLALERRHPDVP